ncbi:hypothetical protein V2P20_09095 [Methylobacter sp. Wu1]|uniref:hypothetical protein n=1 Tax=Methylobacter sp. Wu1 TaxID=3119359 RepID=UPI002F955235
MNRLFIYDPETNTAVCIAKGYSTGWSTSGDSEYMNEFYELIEEYPVSLSADNPTRLVLHTEETLPKCERIIFPK